MVTRNDVAKLAKVSPAVVSYVINNSNYVSAEKRKAVLAAIEELNYIPNQNAKNLRQGKTNMIAVIRGSSLNDMFNDLLFYLEDLANELGYHIALITVSKTEYFYATDAFISNLISRHYDAIFVANSSLTEEQINLLVKSGTKVLLYVTHDYTMLNPSVSQIIPHYRQAVKEAISRLIKQGHKRISLLPNLAYPMSQHTSTNHRFAGYMDAFIENHLPLNMQYVPASCSSLSQVSQWIDRMFDPENPIAPPTAICADEPIVVATALKKLTSMGYRVPEDVSLICFSNSTLVTLLNPELTSIGFNPHQFAQLSLDMLIELIEGKPGRNELVELSYYERESTGPAPEE